MTYYKKITVDKLKTKLSLYYSRTIYNKRNEMSKKKNKEYDKCKRLYTSF